MKVVQTHTYYSGLRADRRLVLAYKNRPLADNVSHIGLGVSALNTAKVLRTQGVYSEVWAIVSAADLASQIARASPPPSHVVICAPWLAAAALQGELVFRYPAIRFAVVCHSNAAFLGADPQAIRNFRDLLSLEQGSLNLQAAGNNRRFKAFIEQAYRRPCLWLPNLYYLESDCPPHRRAWTGGTIRIGSFGAVRPLKNHTSAAAAALEIAERLNTDVEFHISVGRIEGGYAVVRAIEAMLLQAPNVTLVKDDWYQWPRFRSLVRSMHVLIQPSFSETFNMVTADGVSVGVPSVVDGSIDWTPRYWQADGDSVTDIARVARHLLTDEYASADGYQALIQHNESGAQAWCEWLA